MSSPSLFLCAVYVFMKICQQITITIYIGLYKYKIPVILLLLQILDMLPKAMYRVSTYKERKAPEQSKGYSYN